MRLFSPSYGKKDAIFLAIVFFTLCLFASFFALHQDHQAYGAYCAAADHTKEEACKLDKPFVEKLLGDPASFFTAVLAVLTFILAFVGIAQFYFLLRADETSRRSADAAKQAADVARDTLLLGRQDQRSWLFIQTTSQNAHDWLHHPCSFEWKFNFYNLGTRPALIKMVEVCATICDRFPVSDTEIENSTVRFPTKMFMQNLKIEDPILNNLHHSEEFSARGDRNGPSWKGLPSQVAAERKRLHLMVVAPNEHPDKVWFWLIGRVLYEDVMSKELHITQFCLRIGLPFPDIQPFGGDRYNYRT